MAEEFELKYDCLIEILSRLPVKSLIRFTCVSKGWLSLIRSPEFITKHHDFHHNSHHQSVLALFTSGCSISLFSDQNHNQNLSFQTAFKFRPAVVYDPPQYQIYHRDIIQDCSIVGPCNGLFLISLVKGFSHVLLLWNPATREVFKLPDNSHFTCCLIHGFGFDTVSHDYKVVGLYAHIEGIIDNTVVCLYSLATNSWTRLYHAYDDVCTQYDVPYMRVSPFGNGSSSNGRMQNWISSHYHLGALRHCLLSFDMVDEVFVQTPLPPDVVSAPLGLLSHGSKYPRVFSFGDTNHLHIWVLQAYGPTGVWNKLLDINFPESEWRPTAYAALWNNNSQFVFSPYGTLISFNLTTKQMTSLGIPVDTDLTAYTESLVPIAKSAGQQPPIIRHSHHLDQQQHFQFQQQHDDDDDSDDSSSSSSVDSAFVTPDITAFNDFNTVYIDYETDLEFYPRRKNEVDRLSNLPYCLREVNHPIVSKPCTF